MEANGNILRKMDVLAAITRDGVHLFGALIDCQVLTPEGNELPRYILIGDDSVVVVPVLTCQDNGEIYTMMVEQRRIIDGGFSIEFPAGSVGGNEEPRAMASQEIQEELNLSIAPGELIPLAPGPIKINPSFSGDLTHFFYFEKVVSRSFLEERDLRSTGCHEEHEYLHVRVLKMADVRNHLTSSALIGTKLLETALNRTF